MHPRKISDVALSWGFADVAHFSRRFKHRFGETPRAFCRRVAKA
jgi:AraC-like DNA-binding protein